MFSSEFYESLDPTYRQHLFKLESDLKDAEEKKESDENSCFFMSWNSIDQCKILLKEFASKFMMPMKLWDLLFEYFENDENKIIKYLKLQSNYHFCFGPESDVPPQWEFNRELRNRPMDSHSLESYDKVKLEHLQDYLREYRNAYEQHCSSMLPMKLIRRYEKVKDMCEKLKSSEEDDQKWMEAISKAQNVGFVEHNVESRISQNLSNKALWKLYIRYLKGRDSQTLLQTYSKYCRFFLDDSEMKEEYRKFAANFGAIEIPWSNPFDFEKTVEPAEEATEKAPKSMTKSSPSPKLHFDNSNALRQIFPFHDNSIDYILKNANAQLFHKFFETCKWFHLKNPFSICHKIEFSTYAYLRTKKKLKGQTLYVHYPYECYTVKEIEDDAKKNPFPLSNMWIATIVQLFSLNMLRKNQFFENLYRCDARQVIIRNQHLTAAEMKLLIQSGNVVILDLEFFGDGEEVMLEDILKWTPKLEKLSIDGVCASFKTFQILTELPFESKIYHFSATLKTKKLDMNSFSKFVIKNFAPKTEIRIVIPSLPELLIDEYQGVLTAAVNSHWPENERPSVVFFD